MNVSYETSVFHPLLFFASRRWQCFDSPLPLDFRLLFLLQEKGKQKGSTRNLEVSRNIYLLYSHGPNFHNASVRNRRCKRWLENGLTLDLFLVEALQNPPLSNDLERWIVRSIWLILIFATYRFEVMKILMNLIHVFHTIIWIERQAQRALNLMLEKEKRMEIPEKQRMEREESLAREHNLEYKATLRQAVTLDVPHADSISSEYGTFDKTQEDETEEEETEEEEKEETESIASMVEESSSSSSVRPSYKRRRKHGVKTIGSRRRC
ncbi:hypothetical protein IGI04_002659 [Brassica rapa subsp. trilocularis]|uniref:Uncharacterized protein n=1 Tax=Brassica rapa subsp. trilocularis TaxID=1813537 RepID=A0ABQ7NW56_BRACM|nr:hypothetical protein IGI04_002659 [Brassica rapa subsp. trilocularis]